MNVKLRDIVNTYLDLVLNDLDLDIYLATYKTECQIGRILAQISTVCGFYQWPIHIQLNYTSRKIEESINNGLPYSSVHLLDPESRVGWKSDQMSVVIIDSRNTFDIWMDLGFELRKRSNTSLVVLVHEDATSRHIGGLAQLVYQDAEEGDAVYLNRRCHRVLSSIVSASEYTKSQTEISAQQRKILSAKIVDEVGRISNYERTVMFWDHRCYAFVLSPWSLIEHLLERCTLQLFLDDLETKYPEYVRIHESMSRLCTLLSEYENTLISYAARDPKWKAIAAQARLAYSDWINTIGRYHLHDQEQSVAKGSSDFHSSVVFDPTDFVAHIEPYLEAQVKDIVGWFVVETEPGKLVDVNSIWHEDCHALEWTLYSKNTKVPQYERGGEYALESPARVVERAKELSRKLGLWVGITVVSPIKVSRTH